MSAFKTYHQNALNNAIVALHNRMKSINPQPLVTPQQLIRMYASEQDTEALIRVAQIAHVSRHNYNPSFEYKTKAGKLKASFDIMDNSTTPFVPKKPQFQPDVDPELRAAIDGWIACQFELGKDFGRAGRIVTWLDDHCSNPAQARYMWPSLLALCRIGGRDMEKMAEELQVVKQPQKMPAVGMHVRESMRLASTTVASALLVDRNKDEIELPVQISLHSELVDDAELGSYYVMT